MGFWFPFLHHLTMTASCLLVKGGEVVGLRQRKRNSQYFGDIYVMCHFTRQARLRLMSVAWGWAGRPVKGGRGLPCSCPDLSPLFLVEESMAFAGFPKCFYGWETLCSFVTNLLQNLEPAFSSTGSKTSSLMDFLIHSSSPPTHALARFLCLITSNTLGFNSLLHLLLHQDSHICFALSNWYLFNTFYNPHYLTFGHIAMAPFPPPPHTLFHLILTSEEYDIWMYSTISYWHYFLFH